jgi:hypothetical protein
MKMSRTAMILVGLLILSVQAFAEDTLGTQPQGMPQMGPPAEMKQVNYLIGTWDYSMKMKMTPEDTSWMESKGTEKYESVYGDAALQFTNSQDMMGMPFIAGGLICYDRDTKKWQMTWTDNMSAKISLYTGTRTVDGSVFEGSEVVSGVVSIYRMTSSKQTPTSFDWKGEMTTDNGKTWMTWGMAKYTKRK